MKTTEALFMGAMHRNEESMVFDWDRAAKLIVSMKPGYVSAGLKNDWEWTGGLIYDDEIGVIPQENTYTYLASTWATPEINIDDDKFDCYIDATEAVRRWGNTDLAKLYWPQSALDILYGNTKIIDMTKSISS